MEISFRHIQHCFTSSNMKEIQESFGGTILFFVLPLSSLGDFANEIRVSGMMNWGIGAAWYDEGDCTFYTR